MQGMINPTDHELLRWLLEAPASKMPIDQRKLWYDITTLAADWREKHGRVLPPKGGA